MKLNPATTKRSAGIDHGKQRRIAPSSIRGEWVVDSGDALLDDRIFDGLVDFFSQPIQCSISQCSIRWR